MTQPTESMWNIYGGGEQKKHPPFMFIKKKTENITYLALVMSVEGIYFKISGNIDKT